MNIIIIKVRNNNNLALSINRTSSVNYRSLNSTSVNHPIPVSDAYSQERGVII